MALDVTWSALAGAVGGFLPFENKLGNQKKSEVFDPCFTFGKFNLLSHFGTSRHDGVSPGRHGARARELTPVSPSWIAKVSLFENCTQ